MKLLDHLLGRRRTTKKIIEITEVDDCPNLEHCIERWKETEEDEREKHEVKERLNFAERARIELAEEKAWLERQARIRRGHT